MVMELKNLLEKEVEEKGYIDVGKFVDGLEIAPNKEKPITVIRTLIREKKYLLRYVMIETDPKPVYVRVLSKEPLTKEQRIQIRNDAERFTESE